MFIDFSKLTLFPKRPIVSYEERIAEYHKQNLEDRLRDYEALRSDWEVVGGAMRSVLGGEIK